MKIETDKIFIYGAFDILKKGLTFALGSDCLSDNEKIEIRNTIDAIGNYSTSNPSEKQLLFKRIKTGDFLLLAYSFGGVDEYKRKSFVSKGIILDKEQFKLIHNNPFFILQKFDIDYSALISEFLSKKAIPIEIDIQYNLQNIQKYVSENKNIIIAISEAMLKESNLVIDNTKANFELLKQLFLTTKIDERVKITFSTALSNITPDFKICCSSTDSNFIVDKGLKNSKMNVANHLIDLEKSNNIEDFYNFIFDKNKKGVIQRIIRLIFKNK